jgi:CBS domain containing-hemolysin-like protein
MPEGDYETIAGLVLERLGKIPVSGDGVDVEGWALTVATMDRHRIAELSVRRLEEPDSPASEEAAR